jgi:hypothetical protein
MQVMFHTSCGPLETGKRFGCMLRNSGTGNPHGLEYRIGMETCFEVTEWKGKSNT